MCSDYTSNLVYSNPRFIQMVPHVFWMGVEHNKYSEVLSVN